MSRYVGHHDHVETVLALLHKDLIGDSVDFCSNLWDTKVD